MPELNLIAASKISGPLREAILRAPMQGLAAGPAVPGLVAMLKDQDAWSSMVACGSREKLPVIEAALWLAAGDLDRSHDISQDNSSPEGSFFHGVMHRREGDFGNASYWFRRVGKHAAYLRIEAAVRSEAFLGENFLRQGTSWDPLMFVEKCSEAAKRSGGSLKEQCMLVQWLEWQAMVDHILCDVGT